MEWVGIAPHPPPFKFVATSLLREILLPISTENFVHLNITKKI